MDNAEAWGVAETAVSAARAGRPTVLVIEGDAGLGKTRLLRLLTRALGDFEVHRAYGEPDAPDIAFRTLRELTAATGVAEPTGPFQAVSELLALVDGRERPLALLIDDLQWADAESVRALAGLLRRAEGDHLLLAVATRPLGRAHAEWQRMLRDAHTVAIRLDGLTVDEVDGLAREAEPGASRALAEALHEHTAGNPLHVISLLNEHTVDGLTAMAEVDALPAPLELAARVEARVQGLSPDAGELLSALAVLGDAWVALETAGAVAGVDDPRGAVRLLVQERLVRTRGVAPLVDVRIFHSVLRAAVYEIVPDERRRRLHRAAAAHVSDPSARLRHRVAAADAAHDADLAAELISFADDRHADRQFREAARFLRIAASVTREPAARDALLLDAQVESLLGLDADAAREHLGTGDVRDRLVVAMSLTARAEWHRAWTMLSTIADDELAGLPERVAYRVRVTRLFDALGSGRPAAEILVDIAAAERLAPDPAVQRNLLFTKLQVTAWTVGDEEVYWAMAGLGQDRSAMASTPQGRSLLAWRGIVQTLDGNLAESIADLSVATALVGSGGLDFTEGTYHALLGLAQYLSGDVARAAASIDVALSAGLNHVHPVSLAISGLRELVGGDVALARAAMADVRAGLLRNRYRGALLNADIVDLLVLAAVGTDAERRDWMRRRRQELGDPRDEPLTLAPALWLGLHGLAAGWVGDPDAAGEWARRLETMRLGAPWRGEMVRWIDALAADGRGDDVTDALVALSRAGFASIPVFRGLVARDAAASARRHGRTDAATLRASADALVVAVDPFPATTPVGTAAAADVDPDEGAVVALATLSERERAVVALVAGGLSYAQIAKELYITRSTVGFHLSNCYAKTGTRTRHELADLARAAGLSPRLTA